MIAFRQLISQRPFLKEKKVVLIKRCRDFPIILKFVQTWKCSEYSDIKIV